VEANWRVVVSLAVPAAVVALFLVLPPADLGPRVSAAVVGGAAVALSLTRFPTSVTPRVALAATLGLFASGIGFVMGLGWHIGPSQHDLSRAVSGIGVPGGFVKSDDYGCDSGPFCPETVYTRSYFGTGSVAALADTMLARMRKACFTDATIGPGGSFSTVASLVVSGTCTSRHARVDVGIGEEQTAPGRVQVRIAFSASGL